MERDDIEIIADIKKGKETAMDELIKKHQKRVFNTAFGLTRDYNRAWDVSQEVFVKTINNIEKFRGDSAFTTYLYRIIQNTFYDYKRKEKVRWRFSNFSDVAADDDPRVFEVADALNIEEDYDRKNMRENIAAGLETLTDIQREVFVLKSNGGFKIREISKILKISEGTVKSHLNRGMEKLKVSVGGDNNE